MSSGPVVQRLSRPAPPAAGPPDHVVKKARIEAEIDEMQMAVGTIQACFVDAVAIELTPGHHQQRGLFLHSGANDMYLSHRCSGTPAWLGKHGWT